MHGRSVHETSIETINKEHFPPPMCTEKTLPERKTEQTLP